MQCNLRGAYAGWFVRDKATGEYIEDVEWVDPDSGQYCRMPASWVSIVYAVHDVSIDLGATTFWIEEAVVTVAPLHPGRQADPEPSDKPCGECCQEAACRRTGYCAAHRRGFGEVAP
jgi:hypothetical protein